MINTSNEYKTAIKGAREMYADVSIAFLDGTKLSVDQNGLFGLSIEDNVSGTDSFDIGSAIINQLTLKLDNTDERYDRYDFDGARITVKTGLQLSKAVEWLNKGIFTADPGEYTGDVITVKAYDNMKKFDRKYSESKLVYPASLGSIVRDACDVCGVSLSTTSFSMDGFVVQKRPTDEALTFREILAWVGQIACLWCRCNAHGALELGWYDQKGYEDGTGNFFELQDLASSSICTDDVVITGVKVVQEKETDDGTVKTEYLSGKEGYILSVEENELIQDQNGRTIADSLGEKLIGLRFRKLSVTHKSDPSMEAGDLCRVTDWRGRTYKTLVTGTNFQFGNNQKTECSAETPSRNNADRFSQQTKNYVKLRKQVSAEKTAREKAIEDLTNALAASSGLYITTVKQSDGSSIYYMHNKPVLEESDIVWKITAEAFGISTDGGKTYPFGFQVTGEMVAKLLAVDGINASWINTGIFRIADKSGNEVLYADVDTGIVRINAQNITIGGEPIASEKYVSDKLQSLNALNIILSNDYYSVPVDAQGVIPSGALAGADTIVTVLWGTQDITANVKIVITESAGVSGTWTDETKRYAVSDLTADNAWVDFSVTYNGVNLVKRYTIVKRHSGKSFQLGCSTTTVKRAAQGELFPHYLDFESFSFDTEAKRKDYAGRFVVEESEDAINWKAHYISEEDESFLRYHFYSPIVTASGKYITDALGRFIAIPRVSKSITAIRATLYAAGGTTDIIDRQTISIITDAAMLSSEEYFDLLTDNGRIQGIFMRGDQLFINGEYVQTRGLKAVDKSGNMTFYVNDDGEVLINAKSLEISGSKAATEEYAEEAAADEVNGYDATLGQQKIFDKLTNGGETQGIYIKDGKLYINGEFIEMRGMKLIDNSGNVVFSVNADGSLVMNPQNLSIAGNKAATEGYADLQADEAMNYANIQAEYAKEYAKIQTATAEANAKKYTDDFNKTLGYEEVLKRLTNDGQFKGIYMDKDDAGNDQLYILFTYARGGALTLGGVDNNNGTLNIIDKSGEVIGTWGKDGISIKKGSVTGTNVILGGVNDGTLVIKDADGKEIGRWGKNGITAQKGTFSGAVHSKNADTNNFVKIENGEIKGGNTTTIGRISFVEEKDIDAGVTKKGMMLAANYLYAKQGNRTGWGVTGTYKYVQDYDLSSGVVAYGKLTFINGILTKIV